MKTLSLKIIFLAMNSFVAVDKKSSNPRFLFGALLFSDKIVFSLLKVIYLFL